MSSIMRCSTQRLCFALLLTCFLFACLFVCAWSFLQHYVDFCSASLLSQFPYLSMWKPSIISTLYSCLSVFFSYFLSPTNSHSLETVGDCFNGQYSIHTLLLVFAGQCGDFSFSPVLIRERTLLNLTICLCMGCVAKTNPPSNNGVFSNPVCCMDCKSFQSWCTCLKSDPIPKFDPDLNLPQNLSFPETSLSSSLAPS